MTEFGPEYRVFLSIKEDGEPTRNTYKQQRLLRFTRQAILKFVYSMASGYWPSRFADVTALAFLEFLLRHDGVAVRASRSDKIHPVGCMEGCYTLMGG